MLQVTFDVKRLIEIADSKEEWQDYLTLQRGSLQPDGDESVGDPGRNLELDRLYTNRIDVKNTDKIVIGDDTYIISEIKDYNIGCNAHLKIYISNENSN